LQSLTDLGISVDGTEKVFIEADNPELLKTYRDKIENQNHNIAVD